MVYLPEYTLVLVSMTPVILSLNINVFYGRMWNYLFNPSYVSRSYF